MPTKSEEDPRSSSEDEGPNNDTSNKKRSNGETNKEPKPKRIKNLLRQPTTAELNQLHQTENLFNSNLFRLQINEVLQEVKVKEKTCKRFQAWLEKLKLHLQAIPEDDTEYDLSNSQLRKQLKVKIPINEKLEQTKITFKFHKYKDLTVIGSYKFECAINSKLCVDISMIIPSETFTKNDSVNYRYHKKRACYLAFIASHLSKCDIVTDVQYSLLDGCESNPILELKPDGKLGDHLTVRLHLMCDENSFKLARFAPSRNNLRESWFFSETETEPTVEGRPTPFYNASVLQDLTHSVNLKFLEETLGSGDNLKQAIVLLKIWLRQRDMEVSGHVVNMLVAYLVHIRRINNIMSSYQIVRNVWIYICSSDWDTKGISICKGPTSDSTLAEFLASFPVVFLDKTGNYNVCWRMTKGTYAALKRESSLAVKMLDNPNINSFIPLFMTTQKFYLQFDHILKIKNVSTVKSAVYNRINNEDKLNYGIDKTHLITKKLYDIISRGVGNRAHLILAAKNSQFSWSVKESWKKAHKRRSEDICLGFSLNAEEALNTIEKGPPANLPEAEIFRAFWGDKSELRRFQDGSITETCVWEGETLAQRRLVVKQIVLYLLKFKFGIEEEIFYIADQLDSVLACKQYRPAGFEYGTGEEATVNLMQAFDSLRKDLRNLTDLPLHINSVYGTSPVFSYADPLPPLNHPSPQSSNHWYREKCCLIKDGQKMEGKFDIRLPKYIKTSRAVIEFGHSGKWPGTLEAFHRLKAAFNIQIAENLSGQFSLSTHAYPDHVNVLKDGYVFRLEIAHQKEINLMKRSVENGVVKHRETEESLEMLCQMILLPRLRGALHGLHQNHPAYGPTTALAKRWLSSHLLDSSHVPHAVVELLAARVFVLAEPYAPPAQPTHGFLALLALLARTDWGAQPLLLNFNGLMTREEIIEIESKFTESRPTLPPLYVATPYDLESPSVWSRSAPTHNVLARVQILAASALKYLEESLMRDMLDNVMGIFVPSLTGYDALIHLHPRFVPDHAELVTEKPVLLQLDAASQDAVIPVVDFNPVEKYLLELRRAYDEFALFFHDTYGGSVIALLWKPHVTAELEFQVSRSNGVRPVPSKTEATKCIVNVEAIIEDFKIIGEGLVKEITIG